MKKIFAFVSSIIVITTSAGSADSYSSVSEGYSETYSESSDWSYDNDNNYESSHDPSSYYVEESRNNGSNYESSHDSSSYYVE